MSKTDSTPPNALGSYWDDFDSLAVRVTVQVIGGGGPQTELFLGYCVKDDDISRRQIYYHIQSQSSKIGLEKAARKDMEVGRHLPSLA